MKQLGLGLSGLPRAPRPGAMRSFHPRLETPAEAIAGEERAASQEARLLSWFRSVPGRRFTASEINGRAGLKCPLTSTRRALTNMAKRGEILHHREDRRPGPFGARESTWSLA